MQISWVSPDLGEGTVAVVVGGCSESTFADRPGSTSINESNGRVRIDTHIEKSGAFTRPSGATEILKLKPRSWGDDGLRSIVEITTPRRPIGPKRWRRVASGLFPAGWQMLGLLRRVCAPQVPDVPPVRSGPGRIATIRRKGSEAVEDKAGARMPPGLVGVVCPVAN